MMGDGSKSTWNRWLVLLVCHCLLLHSLMLMLRVAATYQAIRIGLDGFWIGVIGGGFAVLPAIVGLHLGGVIERLGEAPSFILGGGLTLAAALMFLLLGDAPFGLVLASVTLGLGQFICAVTEQSAIGRLYEGFDRDAAFGYLTVAISLAHAIGPMIVWLYGRGMLIPDTHELFVAGVVLSVPLLVIGAVTRPPGHHYEATGHSFLGTLQALVGTPGFLISSLAALAIFAAMDLLAIYLPLYGSERGIEAGVIAILLSIRAVASVISRLMFRRLLNWFGRGSLLVAAMLLAGASIGLFPASDAPIVMASLMFAAGLGLGIGAPLTLSWVSEIAPSGMRARALSLRLAINRVGQAGLPVMVGVAAASVGAAGVLVGTSSALAATAAISAWHFKIRSN